MCKRISKIWTLIKQILTKYQFFTKLPPISQTDVCIFEHWDIPENSKDGFPRANWKGKISDSNKSEKNAFPNTFNTVLTCLKRPGGPMDFATVFRIFYYYRVNLFWLVLFVIVTLIDTLLLKQNIQIGPVIFSLISIN